MMIHNIYEGPKERWRAELDKLNTFALQNLIEQLVAIAEILPFGMKRDLDLLDMIENSRHIGRSIAHGRRVQRFLDDPKRSTAEWVRRSKSAKKAARRRKQGR